MTYSIHKDVCRFMYSYTILHNGLGHLWDLVSKKVPEPRDDRTIILRLHSLYCKIKKVSNSWYLLGIMMCSKKELQEYFNIKIELQTHLL